MPQPLLYLKVMGLVAIVSATVVLVMAGVRRPASSARLNAACVLGFGVGLAVGCRLLSLRWTWPPMSGLDRFTTIVIPLALGIELSAGLACVPRWVAWSLRVSLAAAIPPILLHGSVYVSRFDGDWTVLRAGTTLAVCAAMLAGLWGLLSWLSQRSPGVSISFALCLATLCAGLTVMMAGYIRGGVAAFAYAATLAGMTVGARLSGAQRAGAPAILGIGVVGMFGQLLIGRFFGRLSAGSALVMLLAPLLCWAAELPRLRCQKPWLVGLLRLALVAIPLLAVLAVAKRDFDQNMAPLLGNVPTTSARSANVPTGEKAYRSSSAAASRLPRRRSFCSFCAAFVSSTVGR